MGFSLQPLCLHLGPSLGNLPHLRSALRSWLTDVGVPCEQGEEIVLACWEVAANAVEHPVHADGDILVEAHRRDDDVVVSVTDTGIWRARDLPRAEGGFGLRLVEALMDRVQVVPSPNGTRVTMWRRLSPPGRRQRGRATSTCGVVTST